MGKADMGRVLAGGILAGLVFSVLELVVNVGLLGGRWMAVFDGTGLVFPFAAVFLWGVGGIALCIVGVWLYVALRPCAGPGPRTAMIAGTVLWCGAFAYPSLGLFATPAFPGWLVAFAMVWGLVELNLAMLAGAWFYREDEALPGRAT
jgi:hypothetical protein